jgi:hypothetical protein
MTRPPSPAWTGPLWFSAASLLAGILSGCEPASPESYPEALEESKRSGKPILLHFTAVS